MNPLSILPESFTFMVGVQCTDLGPVAKKLEASLAYRKAFVATVGTAAGFEPGGWVLPFSPKNLSSENKSLLGYFDENGDLEDQVLTDFLSIQLKTHAAGGIELGPLMASCCYRTPTGWKTCHDFLLHEGGEPMTAAAAIPALEKSVGAIQDAKARAELAALQVQIRVEWVVPLG